MKYTYYCHHVPSGIVIKSEITCFNQAQFFYFLSLWSRSKDYRYWTDDSQITCLEDYKRMTPDNRYVETITKGMDDRIDVAAQAMESYRLSQINRPLARLWKELAQVALTSK